MYDSLWPHGLQHTRPPCPLSTPGVYSNSYPLSQWCHPMISSVVLFSSCLQSFPASGSFQMSQLFASCGQSTGVAASTSVLPMNTQDWSPLGWTGWIDLLAVQGTLKSLLQHHSLNLWKSFFVFCFLAAVKLSRGFLHGISGKEPFCQCRRCKRYGFDPWFGKIPWKRKWYPTAVFLPRKSQRKRSLAVYSPWDCKIAGHDWGSEHIIKYLGLQNS